jgi:predicted RNase H-like HicB family nuclease
MAQSIRKRTGHYTAVISREGNAFVALCPELHVVSEGDTLDEARANLQEAVELFLETASPQEIEERSLGETYVTHLEVAVG